MIMFNFEIFNTNVQMQNAKISRLMITLNALPEWCEFGGRMKCSPGAVFVGGVGEECTLSWRRPARIEHY